ncbi:MAG: BlaR1 family beta-lactam sensor/signal transducer [Lachnospiraceae bacterium]|nr:BlaR1 family beta-lactam sensor/signal transducer [Lachnospiraceae bacterium]
MGNFMIRFLICNIFISGIVGILLILKKIFKNSLSSRMQYNLWFILLGLLAVPFIPFSPIGFPQIFSLLGHLKSFPVSNTGISMAETIGTSPTGNTNWMNNFTLSVNSAAPSIAGFILFVIWIAGIFAMIILVIKSSLRLRTLAKSALPLQNSEVRRLYRSCLSEIGITKNIPIYSTAFLKSPIMTGVLKPRIYLPIHLISDYHEPDMRYMLLHELQHYKHKDTLASFWMNLAGIIYWFNPFVWYALKEMRNDREVACDTSVLKMLEEDAYTDYGNTLINYVEKVSLTPFPFASGLSGNMKQMKKRIINIASYEKPTLRKKIKGLAAFILTVIFLLGFAPFISTYAADKSHYQWKSSSENISYINLSAYFDEYDGSFVLYDLKNNVWSIHDMEHATLRVAPDSTYKIYDALFGLEENIITPEDSLLTWSGENYPIEAWNADQTLQSAMDSSVNWYFQTIDNQLGTADLSRYIQEIGYGNKNMSADLSSYWLESSLAISPVEQVELLTKLQNNSFGFSPENIAAVKNAIRLSSSDDGTFYGKTGSGRINGKDVNGWFVGFVESADNTYFFAVNINADDNANGISAAEITMAILSDMDIWK